MSEQDLLRDVHDVALRFQDRHRIMSEKFDSSQAKSSNIMANSRSKNSEMATFKPDKIYESV